MTELRVLSGLIIHSKEFRSMSLLELNRYGAFLSKTIRDKSIVLTAEEVDALNQSGHLYHAELERRNSACPVCQGSGYTGNLETSGQNHAWKKPCPHGCGQFTAELNDIELDNTPQEGY